MKTFRLIVTEDEFYAYLNSKYTINLANHKLELIEMVCYGVPQEVTNILQCDLYGDELDFTLKYDYGVFEDQVDEIIQDLIDSKIVMGVKL